MDLFVLWNGLLSDFIQDTFYMYSLRFSCFEFEFDFAFVCRRKEFHGLTVMKLMGMSYQYCV